jgi:hypothetical protein
MQAASTSYPRNLKEFLGRLKKESNAKDLLDQMQLFCQLQGESSPTFKSAQDWLRIERPKLRQQWRSADGGEDEEDSETESDMPKMTSSDDESSDDDEDDGGEDDLSDGRESKVIFDKRSMRYYQIPTSYIQLKLVTGKGLGVFARRKIQRGGYLVYEGFFLRNLQGVKDRRYVIELPSVCPTSLRRKFTYINGDPQLNDTTDALGCYCNDDEHSPNAFATYRPSIGKLVIIVGVNVTRGTEICFNYGKRYPRTW